jgi:hypothetical protein
MSHTEHPRNGSKAKQLEANVQRLQEENVKLRAENEQLRQREEVSYVLLALDEIGSLVDLGGAKPHEIEQAIVARIAKLEEEEQRHLRLIRRLTTDAIPEDEATELRAQIAALTVEVGTLRARIDGFGSVHTMPKHVWVCTICGKQDCRASDHAGWDPTVDGGQTQRREPA